MRASRVCSTGGQFRNGHAEAQGLQRRWKRRDSTSHYWTARIFQERTAISRPSVKP